MFDLEFPLPTVRKRQTGTIGRDLPIAYLTNKNAIMQNMASKMYKPQPIAVAIGGVVWATMKLDIQRDAVQSALPLA